MANEKRLIDANALLESKWWDSLKDPFDKARAKIIVQSCPTVDAVSMGVHEQVRWERDIAISQLESYGISLGEKTNVAKSY